MVQVPAQQSQTLSSMPSIAKQNKTNHLLFYFFGSIGVELRALCLLGRATPQPLSFLFNELTSYLSIRHR
jgi:hypothetical protein